MFLLLQGLFVFKNPHVTPDIWPKSHKKSSLQSLGDQGDQGEKRNLNQPIQRSRPESVCRALTVGIPGEKEGKHMCRRDQIVVRWLGGFLNPLISWWIYVFQISQSHSFLFFHVANDSIGIWHEIGRLVTTRDMLSLHISLKTSTARNMVQEGSKFALAKAAQGEISVFHVMKKIAFDDFC